MKKLSIYLAIAGIMIANQSLAMRSPEIIRLQLVAGEPASKTELALMNGANPNEQDASGNTALMYVIQRIALEPKLAREKIKILMRYGANPSIKNNDGVSVYSWLQGRPAREREFFAQDEALIRYMDAQNKQDEALICYTDAQNKKKQSEK
jgi:hypothetical protein